MNQNVLTLLVVLAIVSYVFWGVFHHSRRGDLHSKVFLEYFALGLLGLIIVLGVIKYL